MCSYSTKRRAILVIEAETDYNVVIKRCCLDGPLIPPGELFIILFALKKVAL